MAGLAIVGLAGSLRQASYNRALLRAAAALAPEGMTIDIFDLAEVPLYNGDVEAGGDPEAVARLKLAIAASDGVLMATPEYNHGVPAVMKNAVDWASRPPGSAVLAGKPVGIIGASPGMTGSARGQSQLRQAFEFTNSYCMPQPELLVFKAHEKFGPDGDLADEATARYLVRYLTAFAACGASSPTPTEEETAMTARDMEVIGADGVHVGTVDRVEGDRIKLTKADSGQGSHEGHHHFISLGLVAMVEGSRVRLSANGDVAVQFEEERDS
jgi:chromate reductase